MYKVQAPYDLGVNVGDVIWGESSQPSKYRIDHITGPLYWTKSVGGYFVYLAPIWNLSGIHTQQGGRGYFNCVRRTQQGVLMQGVGAMQLKRWKGQKINVSKGSITHQPKMKLFPDPRENPWTFQEGVDYLAGDGFVFHCEKCGRDFNGERRVCNPYCECGSGIVSMSIFMMDRHADRSRSLAPRLPSASQESISGQK